jgi:hypothetical protein
VLIEQLGINEVIIAMPEKGHRETVRVISYCERGRVSIKIFPDVFQFVTSQASIDELGGLPLLSVRDYALRGYLLIFKRSDGCAGGGVWPGTPLPVDDVDCHGHQAGIARPGLFCAGAHGVRRQAIPHDQVPLYEA